jgi:hypothetical protein
MFKQTVVSLLSSALFLACAAAAAPAPGPDPRARAAVPVNDIRLKAAPLPRLANGRVDSNAVFDRIAASRADKLALLARLDRYKLRALVAAVARNDNIAIDNGFAELIALSRAIAPGGLAEADIGELIMVICKAAAVEAYADLAGVMKDMNARRAQKETLRSEELALLHARLVLCDANKPCAPPEGKPLYADGVALNVIRPGTDRKQSRVESLAAAVAMIAANADRMDKLAQSLLQNNKP